MQTVLFLCTGNSARSILAEAVLNARGRGRHRALSAGSQPKDTPHPVALSVLEAAGYPTTGAGSKSWQEFSDERAPRLDLVITLCDSAAAEACPAWTGAPVTVHWGMSDPAAVDGEAACREAFERTLHRLERAIDRLTDLSPALSGARLQAAATAIAREF